MRRSLCSFLFFVLTVSSAGAQRDRPLRAPDPDPAGYKDPQLATVLGLLVPGGGQIYARRSVKGGVLLTLAIAAPIAGALTAAAMHDRCGEDRYRFGVPVPVQTAGQFDQPFRLARGGCRDHNWAPVAAGFGVSVVSWAFGWATAANDARHANRERHRGWRGSMVPVAQPLEGSRTGVGLSFNVR